MNSWIWTRNWWIWTRNLWISTRNSWIWTRTLEFQLLLLSFQLVTRNSCFTISPIVKSFPWRNQRNSHFKHWNYHNSSRLPNRNNNHNTLPHGCSSCQQHDQKYEHCYFCGSSQHFQIGCIKIDLLKNKNKTLPLQREKR